MRFAAACFLWFTVFSHAGEVGRVELRSGDALPGSIMQLSEQELRLRSPLFRSPVSLPKEKIAAITFPKADETEPSEPFRIDTVSGDLLFAQLAGVGAERFLFRAERHGGQFAISRSELVSIRRVESDSLLFDGTRGIAGWATRTKGASLELWNTSRNGVLQTNERGAELFRELRLPTQVQFEIGFRWQSVAGIYLEIAPVGLGEKVIVENWGDELVLRAGKGFESLGYIKKGESRRLRMFYDRGIGKIFVYNQSGKHLASIEGFEKNTGKEIKHTLYLCNRRRDFSLERFRVTKWNGEPPAPIQDGDTRIGTTEGQQIFSHIEGLAKRELRLSGSRTIPLDLVDTIHFSHAPKKSPYTCDILYQDGSMLRGENLSIQDDVAQLRTPYTHSLHASLKRIQSIRFHTIPSSTRIGPEWLEWEGGKLLGRMTTTRGAVGFRFGNHPELEIDPSASLRIVRSEIESRPLDSKRFPDTLYLRNRDVISCKLQTIGEEGVKLESPYSKSATIENKGVKAVELNLAQANHLGFERGWTIEGKKNKLTETEARFSSEGKLWNDSVLGGTEIRFTLQWASNTYHRMRVRFFTQKRSEGDAAASEMKLSLSQSYLAIQWPKTNQRQTIKVDDNTANFAISIQQDTMRIKVDGQEVFHSPKLDQERPGRGMEFCFDQLRTFSDPSGTAWIDLSGFSVRFTQGETALFLPSDLKRKMFLLPRLLSSKPPEHLLVASTGDAMRGNLVRLSDKRAMVRSQIQEFIIPRDRLSGIVWFHSEERPPPRKGEIQFVTNDDRSISVVPIRVEENTVYGSSAHFGDISIPMDTIKEIRTSSLIKVEPGYSDWKLQVQE